MTLEKKQEFTLKISQANKTQMITIHYEMVITYLTDAVVLFEKDNKDEARMSLVHAQDCIDELIHSLDIKYELAQNLIKIYLFSKKELIASGATADISRINRVIKNFDKLHEAYLELEKLDTSMPIMGNTQKVYAGLTYGKHALNEDVSATSMNRGFKA